MSENRDNFGRFVKGSSGFTGTHSESTRRKIREARKIQGSNVWNKGLKISGMSGKKHTQDTLHKMSMAQLGCKNHMFGKAHPTKGIPRPQYSGTNSKSWVGDKIEYSGLHQWLRKIGIPDHCDLCGTTKTPQITKRKTPVKKNYFQWSCRTGIYKRDLHHWWQLCVPCHKNYDFYVLH